MLSGQSDRLRVFKLKMFLLPVCVQAVENPSCAEIRDVLTAAGMNVYVEVKNPI